MSNILQEELNYQKWNFTTTCTGMKITMKINLLQKNSLNFNYQYIYELFIFFTGWVYMILKHAVDRYNIYFAYKPSKINKKIHSSAINFVTVATILLQFNVVFFTALRSGKAVKSCHLLLIKISL